MDLGLRVPIMFEAERRLRCAIARERDLAATVDHPDRRRSYSDRARSFRRALPQSEAERLLLTFG